MQRSPHVLGLLAFVALGVGRLAAEETPSLFAAPSSLPLPETPPPSRAISPEAAAKLEALAPKFSPAVPAPPAPTAAAGPVVPGDDRPRNRILRLPSYVVTEPKIKLPKERHVLTPSGRLDLAYRRHPGLRFGAFGPLNNHFWANALLDEDLAKERSAEWNDLLGLLPGPRRRPVIFTAPPRVIPPRSGPYGGLLVPWERR